MLFCVSCSWKRFIDKSRTCLRRLAPLLFLPSRTEERTRADADETTSCDGDQDGLSCKEDCDDQDPSVLGPGLRFQDLEGDDYGDNAASVETCVQPLDYVPAGGDCDPMDRWTHPGAGEYCDELENDCDGAIDEDAIPKSPRRRCA